MELHQKDLKELRDEGIDAEIIPWFEDKKKLVFNKFSNIIYRFI